MQWYYIKDGQRVGPLVRADFLLRTKQGDITDDTLVWNETMDEWKPYKDVTDPFEESKAAEPGSADDCCSICNKRFAADEMIEFEGKMVCSGCKATFVQQIRENADLSSQSIMRYAGFWRRFAAIFIDGIVMSVVTIPANIGYTYFLSKTSEGASYGVLAGLCYLAMLLVPAVYTILMIGSSGATVGKKAMGIKVVMSDGSKLSFGRATGRYFAYILSGLIIYIGYIMAGFDEQKRALHDHMCNTRVIYS